MKKLLILVLLSICMPLFAGQSTVDGLRVWSAPDHTRLVFDVGGQVEHKLFGLKNPDRLVIDFSNVKLQGKLPDPEADDRFVQRLRYATRNKTDLRVVLDLKQDVRPKSFVLKPQEQYGHRLVIDLEGKGEAQAEPKVAKSVEKQVLRDVVVVIDAGHGGEDPGAIGAKGTREKRVVLAIARRLQKLIDAEPGMRAVMTRTGDYYVGLRKRMDIARKHRADLFVSIHADAFRDRRARGASVYVLSSRGASSEAARWLAERENSADLVGGVKLEDKDSVLASVLLDLSQTATRQASMEVADKVYRELSKLGKIHGRRVQQAGFVVLKSPDVPSLLVETAFISNPKEERKLLDANHQQRMAKAMLAGIRHYFHTTPPPGTKLAAAKPREHVIERGDTLSEIAMQYQVSTRSLRQANRLKNDRLYIGQVLQIPEG